MDMPDDPSPFRAMRIRRKHFEDELWINADDLATAIAMIELEAADDDNPMDQPSVNCIRVMVFDRLTRP